MKDCLKVLVFKFLFKIVIFLLKFKIFLLKLEKLRLKLSNKRLNFKKLRRKFTVFDAFRELRKEIGNVFNCSH